MAEFKDPEFDLVELIENSDASFEEFLNEVDPLIQLKTEYYTKTVDKIRYIESALKEKYEKKAALQQEGRETEEGLKEAWKRYVPRAYKQLLAQAKFEEEKHPGGKFVDENLLAAMTSTAQTNSLGKDCVELARKKAKCDIELERLISEIRSLEKMYDEELAGLFTMAENILNAQTQKEENDRGFDFDENKNPVISTLKNFVKDLRRDDIDIEYVKRVGISEKDLLQEIENRSEVFEEIFARAIGADTERIHTYLTRIYPFDVYIKMVAVDKEIKKLDEEYDFYDDDGCGYNHAKLATINDSLESKSKEQHELKNEIYENSLTADQIRSIVTSFERERTL